MHRILRVKLLAAALAVCAVPVVITAAPALAQSAEDVSFDYFHDQLSPYGNWLYSDRWGLVWQPADVPDDFRPYDTAGHWDYTENYGWLWVSDYPWGDIPFHYGRWVSDPDDGWLWLPGYTWGPGWVVWRSSPTYLGWMPMPPDPYFLDRRSDTAMEFSFNAGGGRVSFGWDDPSFGYRGWYGRDYDDRRFAANWVFVGVGHMGDRDYRSAAVRDPLRVETIINQTRNITNYTVVNNYVVNKSVDLRVVERAAGHSIPVMHARDVVKHPGLIASVGAGQRARFAARGTAPVGSGLSNSAPPPPPRVVEKLSAHVAVSHGRTPGHLFTKTTVVDPGVRNRFHGPSPTPEGGHGAIGTQVPHANQGATAQQPPGKPTPNAVGGTMTGPMKAAHPEHGPAAMQQPPGKPTPNAVGETMTGPMKAAHPEHGSAAMQQPSGVAPVPKSMTETPASPKPHPEANRSSEQMQHGAAAPVAAPHKPPVVEKHDSHDSAADKSKSGKEHKPGQDDR